jgi:enoyl-CoA hydratase/3-hydroxyacyl-CoA dehydrogenase
MPIEEIKKVCFIGSGTMGCFNSLVTSIFGYECVIYDISEEPLHRAPARQREMGEMAMEDNELLTQDLLDAGLARMTYTSDLKEAVTNTDLLSESVPEQLALKRKVHRELDEVCPPNTILTTNTSSLLVSEIEDVVKRGDKFAALHFHLGGSLLDIVGGPRTSPDTIDILKRFARSIMQTPIVLKKEKDGYLFNSMLIALLRTAMLLVIDGFADFQDVDRAYMAASGQPMGPFGAMDRIGINVALDVIEEQSKRGDEKVLKRIADFLRPYVDRGDLGWKTGKGFFTYPDPSYEQPEFLMGED